MDQSSIRAWFDSMDQPVLAVVAFLGGLVIVVEKEKALASVGMVLVATLVGALTYAYLIPDMVPILAEPPGLKWLSTLVITSIGSLAVYKLADGALYLLLFALSAPLCHRFLGSVWDLEPVDDWNQAKLFISLTLSVFLSTFLVYFVSTAAAVASVMFGSLLVAGAVQYVVRGGTLLLGVEQCLLGVEGTECSPFYFSWVTVLFLALVLPLFQPSRPEPPSTTADRIKATAGMEAAERTAESGAGRAAAWGSLKRRAGQSWGWIRHKYHSLTGEDYHRDHRSQPLLEPVAEEKINIIEPDTRPETPASSSTQTPRVITNV
jgi:hypothetical protein